jgi:predicted double-glycine peptidase
MPLNQGNNPLLDVPYYQQTRTATCGPACLMMVMKYWEPSLEFSRKLEVQLWKKSFSLFLFGGTFQFGLAAAASKCGFTAEISQKHRFSDSYPQYPRLVDLIENSVSSRARHEKIPIVYGSDNDVVIRDALRRSIPPIVFINLQPILGENVFHWVVVTGVDGQNVFVNDPYVPIDFPGDQKKGYPVAHETFSLAMTTQTGRNLRFPPCAVLVSKTQ